MKTDKVNRLAFHSVLMGITFFACFSGPAFALPMVVGDWYFNPATGNSYALTEAGTWLDVEATAVGVGGHLVAINDAAESQWILDTFGVIPVFTDSWWIGLNDAETEGTFEWSNGDLVTFENWFSGEPNSDGDEDYVQMYHPISVRTEMTWNDLSGAATLNGIVEVHVVPEPATMTLMAIGLAGFALRSRRRNKNSM